jgi:hypothetical protein
VHQPVAVCGGQCGQHRLHDRHRQRRAEGPALGEQVAQRAAVDQLHHQEDVVAVEPLVVHRDHVVVVDLRRGAGLPLEPVDKRLVSGEARVHDLDRHWPVQPGVQPPVHRRHPAAGEQRVDPVPLLKQGTYQVGSTVVHDRRWYGARARYVGTPLIL